MKPLLMVAGIIILVAGLFFMAQGSGVIPWPAESFMINASRWIFYGGAIAMIGVVLLVLAW
jgi:hypothetical protein